jgi:hypothetical protein
MPFAAPHFVGFWHIAQHLAATQHLGRFRTEADIEPIS